MTNNTVITINGLKKNSGKEIKERIREDKQGNIARPLYTTSVQWINGFQTKTEVKSGAILKGDEPSTYGGSDLGATPQELLLAGIGNCLAATYIGGLSAVGVKVNSLTLNVSGRVNFRAAFGVEEGHPGFESIHVSVFIDADETAENINSLLNKLLPTAPIPDTIMRPVPFAVEIHTSPEIDFYE